MKKIPLKNYINNLVKLFGYQFINVHKVKGFSNSRLDSDYLNILLANEIDLVLDVGAAKGEYAIWLRNIGYKEKIISFEPFDEAHKKLKENSELDLGWTVAKKMALGEKRGKINFNIYNLPSCNSILEADEIKRYLPNIKIVDNVEIDMNRLDELDFEEFHDSSAIMLKADVQGYEKNVIEGARGLLGKINLIQIETSLTSLYKNEVDFHFMNNYLYEEGFYLIYISPEYIDKNGNMVQVNSIYKKIK